MKFEYYVTPLKGKYASQLFEIRISPGVRMPYRKKGSQQDYMLERSRFYKKAYEEGDLEIGLITLSGKEALEPDNSIVFSRIAKQVIAKQCSGMVRAKTIESLAEEVER